MTRMKDETIQLLVFKHKDVPEAGIQVPKGTVKKDETTYDAVIREVKEETGLEEFEVKKLIAEDEWENEDGAIHHRFFYHIHCTEIADEWEHHPTGGDEEQGLIFQFFWISSESEVELIRGHTDYFTRILS